MNLQEIRARILRFFAQHENKHRSRYFLKLVKVLLDKYNINETIMYFTALRKR